MKLDRMFHLIGLSTLAAVIAGFTGGCSNNPTSPQTKDPTSYAASTTYTDGNGPTGLRATGGNLWIAGLNANNLMEMTTGGGGVTTITTFNGSNSFNSPWGIGVAPDGDIYVGDQLNYQVEVFTSSGAYVNSFSIGTTGHDLIGTAFNSAGTTLYTPDYLSNYVYVWSISGPAASHTYTYQSSFGQTGAETLNGPFSVCIDNSNRIYVANNGNGDLLLYDINGNYQSSVTLDNGGTPRDMVTDGAGNIFVTDNVNGEVQVFNAGAYKGNFGYFDLLDANGIGRDSSGTIYVADGLADDIVVFK